MAGRMALPKPDPSQVAAALELLEAFAGDRGLLADIDLETRQRLLIAAGRIALPDAREERKLSRAFRKQRAAEKRAADEAVLAATGIRAARKEAVFLTPPASPVAISAADDASAARGARASAGGEPAAERPRPSEPELRTPRSCYICKQAYTKIHRFYDSMCIACGDFNYERRVQTADLSGRIALVTGGRVKIGYHAVIKLLRAGAKVIVTTRFARDAAARFAKESDFTEWGDRLEVYGLDLRHTPSVERLAAHLLDTLPRLDFIIHNACQTVRRPPGFYAHMLERETAPLLSLPAAEQPLVSAYEALRESEASAEALRLGAGLFEPARLTQKAVTPEDRALPSGTGATQLFPEGRLDQDLQQVDLREMNSWRLRMHEVATIELLEVQLVNAVAPFVLSARLKPLLVQERTFDKHVVNVSAMEGQFNRGLKTENHPHTNMAKAALNMLTRTSAQDYARDGVFMNSVDTGWVTDEDPAVFAEKKALARGEVFQPPLDIVDGAARIVDPIFNGLITGAHVWGKFLKDYRPTEW